MQSIRLLQHTVSIMFILSSQSGVTSGFQTTWWTDTAFGYIGLLCESWHWSNTLKGRIWSPLQFLGEKKSFVWKAEAVGTVWFYSFKNPLTNGFCHPIKRAKIWVWRYGWDRELSIQFKMAFPCSLAWGKRQASPLNDVHFNKPSISKDNSNNSCQLLQRCCHQGG